MINLSNKLQVPETMFNFLSRNAMIRMTGEYKPTVKDVIKAKGKNAKGSFKINTAEAIKKVTNNFNL